LRGEIDTRDDRLDVAFLGAAAALAGMGVRGRDPPDHGRAVYRLAREQFLVRKGASDLRRIQPKGDLTMRFMVIVKATKESEAGILPSREILEKMTKFNEELVKAGVMLQGEGLQASSKGARVKFDGTQRTVTDGPFAETKELIAGFWMWKVKSKE